MKTDFHTEQARQLLLKTMDPLAAIFVVPAGERIIPAEKCSSYAARLYMENLNFRLQCFLIFVKHLSRRGIS